MPNLVIGREIVSCAAIGVNAPTGFRIAHLTSVHYAFDVRIFHKECKTLVAAGYKVILITPHETAECVDGVYIEPVRKQDTRRKRMTATVWDVYRKATACKADIYHFHDPELLPVGVLLKLAGKRVIYDVHEHVAQDTLTKEWIPNRFVRRIISICAGMFEKVSALACSAVVPATPAIAARFPKYKTVIVQNFPRFGDLKIAGSIPYDDRQCRVVYVGAITAIRGVREMIRAVGRVPKRLQARLSLVGGIYPRELEHDLRASGELTETDYLGFKDRSAVSRILGEARAALLVFHPGPNHLEAQPNKLYEYMMAGLPIVASNFPLWKDLINDVGCGITVDPLNIDAISEALTWILDHPTEAEAMGQRGQRAILEKYNWNPEGERLLALYHKLLHPEAAGH